MFSTPHHQFSRFCRLIVIILIFPAIGNAFHLNPSDPSEALESVIEKQLGYHVTFRPREVLNAQQTKLLANDKSTDDNFGVAVALSADGNTALIGAWQEDDSGLTNNGAAYVFVRSGTTWSQQAKLFASDKASGDLFGHAVALSADGNTALIGAHFNDAGGTIDSGAAYVFVRSGTTWSQQGKLMASVRLTGDAFGYSVALSSDGNTALAGAIYQDDTGTADNGAAYVFTRSGTSWSQQATLLASDKLDTDRLGVSVALSANGNTALVGAQEEDSSGTVDNGAAYVFTHSGTSWSQQAKLLASDKMNDDRFGSVTLSADGNTALVGTWAEDESTFTDNGAAYVFIRNGTSWSQQAKLLATDRASSDAFGYSVVLSADGNIALIGAQQEDDAGNNDNGAAYLFTRSGTTWSQKAKLMASDKVSSEYFGVAVAMATDARTALIGAYQEDASPTVNNGAAYVFFDPAPPRTDTIGVYRPSTQTYYLRNSNTTGNPDITVQYGYLCNGSVCNYPILGDWNGDTIDTIGLYDQTSGVFLLRDDNTPGFPTYSFVLGNPSDQPLAGHWTSDMTHDGVGVFRPSNGILYLKKVLSTGVSDYFAIMGNPNDVGVANDWDDDGLDSVGVYRPSQSHFYLTNNSQPSGITFSNIDFFYGDGAQDKPFVGDWTGDGKAEVGVFRNGVVMLRNSLTGGAPDLTFSFGAAGDRPLAGKWIAASQPPGLQQVVVAPGHAASVNPLDADRTD